MISIAPCKASFTLLTPFSSLTKRSASSCRGFFVSCAKIRFDSSSSPFSLATLARVFLLGLYGRYRSSTVTIVSAARIFSRNSSVNLPCSSILLSTCSFFSSRFLRYPNLSFRFLRTSSFNEPVTSFRYLEIKGIVFPSSISFTAASICHFSTFSSSFSFKIMSIAALFPLILRNCSEITYKRPEP